MGKNNFRLDFVRSGNTMRQTPLKQNLAKKDTKNEKVITFFLVLSIFGEKNRSPKLRRKIFTGSARNAKNAFLRRRGRRSKKLTFSKLAEIFWVDSQNKMTLDFCVPFYEKINNYKVSKLQS